MLVFKVADHNQDHEAVYIDAWDQNGHPVRIAVVSLNRDERPRLGFIAPRSIRIDRATVAASLSHTTPARLFHETRKAAR